MKSTTYGLSVLLLISLFSIGCGGGVAANNLATVLPAAAPPAPTPPPSSTPTPPPTPTPAPTPTPPPPAPTPPPAPLPSLPQSWAVTDLVPLAGLFNSQANAVNNLGHAVGYSNSQSSAHGTLWTDVGAIDLGAGTFANGINDSDQIVGYRLDAQNLAHAYLWPDEIELGSLPGFDSSVAAGINNSGEVVGVAFSSANPNLQTGFTWSHAAGMQTIPGCASAEAINDAGGIAGIASNLDAAICGVQDFGMQGAAVAINNLGQAVGYAGNQAWLFPTTDLGPTLATGINDYGWVVGYQILPSGTGNLREHAEAQLAAPHVARLKPHIVGTSLPFVWSQPTGLVMLSNIVTANAINQKGQIVGAWTVDGFTHGVLLTGN